MEDLDMVDARVYIACAPQGAGVSLALFYLNSGERVYGWLAREHGGRCVAVYFDFARVRPPAADNALFCRSVADDALGAWIAEGVPARTVGRCAPPDAWRRELVRLRTEFCREWLFYPDDPSERDEVEAYRRLALPVRPINVRAAQFRRFDRNRPVWVHASPGIDFDLVLYLKNRLPADRREATVLP